MIIKPKVRGFVCVTAHPTGCSAHIQQQIDYVKAKGPIKPGPKKVLVIGASTGFGLSSRITAAFGSGASTVGIFYERPSEEGRPATPGWYNTIAFTKAAKAAGLYAANLNGDAFSDDIKKQPSKSSPVTSGRLISWFTPSPPPAACTPRPVPCTNPPSSPSARLTRTRPSTPTRAS